MKKLIFITVIACIVFAGCKESDDARRINEYLASKGINETVKYRNRSQAINGIYQMIFQNNYFRDNPKEAADFITELEYYEVVMMLEYTLINEIYDSTIKKQLRQKYDIEKRYGHTPVFLPLRAPIYEEEDLPTPRPGLWDNPQSPTDEDFAVHVALISLISIFSLSEKPPVACDALEMFKNIVASFERDYYVDETNHKDGFSRFVLDNETPSILQKFYPYLYEHAYYVFPYIEDLKNAPDEFKAIILNAPYFQKGRLVRSFTASEKLFDSFKATSPKKGAYVFVYDDSPNHPVSRTGACWAYETNLLYPVSNPNNASIIISEKYIYEDITRNYFLSGPRINVYLKHTNVQVKDAVSGKILLNVTQKSTAPEQFTYTEWMPYFVLDDYDKQFLPLIESVVSGM